MRDNDYFNYDNYVAQKLLQEVPEGMLPSDYLTQELGECEDLLDTHFPELH